MAGLQVTIPDNVAEDLFAPGMAQGALVQYLRQGNADLTLAKALGRVVYRDAKSFAIGANGVTLFDGASPFPQVTNVQAQGLKPQSEPAVIYAFRIFFAETTTFATADFEYGVPNLPEVRNGYISVSINGDIKLRRMPLLEALPSGVITSEMVGLITLDLPFIWPGQQNMEVNIDFAGVSSAVGLIGVNALALGAFS